MMFARSQSSFGGWLRALRIKRGIGQAELARRCGLPAPYFSAVERDRRPPPLAKTMEKIVTALNIDDEGRDAVLREASSARAQWVAARMGGDCPHDPETDAAIADDQLAALKCMVREASRSAHATGATVEVSFKQFRYVIRPGGAGNVDAANRGDAMSVNR